MSSDAAALRAELKAFERDFKAAHARAPSVDDIKRAGFADKYKLYKKLAKAPIVPKARAVPTAGTSAANPFSPSKDRAPAHRARAPASPTPSPTPARNPFATPTKARRAAASSPPPLPAPSFFAPAVRAPRTPPAANARPEISRARKRLRGEPVSPSPVKPKRPRTSPIRPPPSSSAFDSDEDRNDDEYDYGSAGEDALEASPQKPRGARVALLFDDAPLGAVPLPPPPQKRKSGGGGGRVQSQSQSQGFFRVASSSAPKPQLQPKPKPAKRGGLLDRGNLRAPPPDASAGASSSSAGRHTPDSRTDGDGDADMLSDNADAPPAHPSSDYEPEHDYALLPPSPPPPSANTYNGGRYNNDKGKSKSKFGTGARKKKSAAADDDEDAGASSDAGAPVTAREWALTRTQSFADADADDDDDEAWQPAPLFRPGAPIALPPFESSQQPPSASTSYPAFAEDEEEEEEPESPGAQIAPDLRRVLDLNARDGGQERGGEVVDEEKVARGVLYGVRAGWYDGARGGEVWDAGGYVEGEEEGEAEWEAEPVPWAAGEL